jgi:hypothetical protein
MILDDKEGIQTELYWDFHLNATNSLSALNLFEGKTLTYSVNPDLVMFRVIKLMDIEDEYGRVWKKWISDDSLNGP